jgi:hypothetical protein
VPESRGLTAARLNGPSSAPAPRPPAGRALATERHQAGHAVGFAYGEAPRQHPAPALPGSRSPVRPIRSEFARPCNRETDRSPQSTLTRCRSFRDGGPRIRSHDLSTNSTRPRQEPRDQENRRRVAPAARRRRLEPAVARFRGPRGPDQQRRKFPCLLKSACRDGHALSPIVTKGGRFLIPGLRDGVWPSG